MQDAIGVDEAIEQFAVFYPFRLDPFQRDAIEIFLAGDSVMVAAPTGTGKTVVAEFGVYESFRRGGRVIYTTPIKALSNQKFRDLRAIYGDNVGLLTGDISENNDAPIVVMTTEVLRNMLLQTPWDLDAVDCIIFDEVHYIADPERGTTWEEAIILCPQHIQLVCLSATVSNAQEIADWITRTHRPIRLITYYERAVPLSLFYFLDKKLHLVIDDEGRQVADFPHTGGEVRRQMSRGGLTNEQRRQAEQAEPQPWEVIQTLAADEMLPAIYFLFSRRDCEEYAQRFSVMRPNLVRDPETTARIDRVVQAYLNGMRLEDRELQQVQQISSLAAQGIGYHHAGLLPILKQLVEVLFSQGLMQVVFATDTLALGVNMPARTVVIGRMTKWDGRRRRPLIPNEFQQMAGRAGRRGMDARGSVVVPYSPWMTFHEVLGIATGELEPVRSSFAVRYNTVLNLWDPPHGNRVRHMLQQSLSQFQSARRVRDLETAILDAGRRVDEVPLGCLIGLDAGDELLDDYRGLNSSITALHGRERRLHRDIEDLRVNYESRPWPEPTRQALRRAFREIPPGAIAHLRSGGWAVLLGRGNRGGVGLFLIGNAVRLLTEYRQIDYLVPPTDVVEVPVELATLDAEVEDAAALVGEAVVERVWRQVAALDLPDLDEAAAEHIRALDERLGRERERIEIELHDVREQASALSRARAVHPCHACLRRKEHQANLKLAASLERDRAGVETDLGKELTNEEERVRRIIRGIRDVLHRFNYLYRGYPTAKADTLANVFDTDGLIICEMIDRGFLDRLSPSDVAEAFSWFAYDRDFRLGNRFTLPKELVLLRRRLDDLEQEVLAAERGNGLFISTGHNDGFYGAMRAWCHGATMSRILEQIELSEGDLVLTFNKTLDLMRQVYEMLGQAMADHPLRDTLARAEALVKRDIVEQSLALGFMPLAPFAGSVDDDIAAEETIVEPGA
ncbi:MAG TPA: DEAD/DEAH box helicase [Thermomicrobiaceae bacterium]|nr:DEAD/DEAH box helicase [Thermomicrobiaceae bacterium]